MPIVVARVAPARNAMESLQAGALVASKIALTIWGPATMTTTAIGRTLRTIATISQLARHRAALCRTPTNSLRKPASICSGSVFFNARQRAGSRGAPHRHRTAELKACQ
jgi:hypothetical protein